MGRRDPARRLVARGRGQGGAPLLVVGLTLVAGCREAEAPRAVGPGTVAPTWPASQGGRRRPAVLLDHAAHVAREQPRGSRACHVEADGRWDFSFVVPRAGEAPDALRDRFHARCRGCHEDGRAAGRASGPVDCDGCHVERPPVLPERVPQRWDYSLHARHVAAEDEECGRCHHLWDEAAGKLVYEDETESTCQSCHGAKDEGRRLSLRRASHRACVGCHLTRAGREAGPTACAGCHTAEAQARFDRLESPERPDRGQPAETWLHSKGAATPEVRFDHARHEPRVRSCSSCHHQTPEACSACHTLTGSPAGGGIGLERAYHAVPSDRSCVGCHRAALAAQACRGCHPTQQGPPHPRTCGRCHAGRSAPPPAPAEEPPPAPAPVAPPVEAARQPPPAPPVAPESVTLGTASGDFQASRFPHARVVAALEAVERGSELARHFHGGPDGLCAGCHHHAPPGRWTRSRNPSPCGACHGAAAAATTDRPARTVAYHRQCLGCHLRMGLAHVGCTDCHAPRKDQEQGP